MIRFAISFYAYSHGSAAVRGCVAAAYSASHVWSGNNQSARFRTIGVMPMIDTIQKGKPASFFINTGASASIPDLAHAYYVGLATTSPLVHQGMEVRGFPAICSFTMLRMRASSTSAPATGFHRLRYAITTFRIPSTHVLPDEPLQIVQ